MKCFYLSTLILLYCQVSFGQCDPVDIFDESQNLNDVQLAHRTDLTFYAENDTEAGFVYADDDVGILPIVFQSSIWMGGYTPDGELKLSANAFQDFEDYVPGILRDIDGEVEQSICDQYNTMWKVSSDDIQAHIDDYEDDGEINNSIPDEILYYPAIANAEFTDEYGFALPTQNIGGLADFVDRNGNGIYEAILGDYPRIRGTESLFFVSNDRSHDNTDFVGVEIQVNSSIDESTDALALSSHISTEISYHGNDVLSDFYIGIWMDADLGCFSNDLVGCLPDSNLIFYYGTESNLCSGGKGFSDGTSPVLLAHFSTDDHAKISSFISLNRGGVGSPPPPTNDPQTSQEVYNLLRGVWRDGITMTYGNEGYNIGSTNFRKYQYDHSNEAENGPWRACDNQPLERDKRTLVSFGPYTLQPKSITNLNFSLHLFPDADLACPTEGEILDLWKNISRVLTPIQEATSVSHVQVSPNPFSHRCTIHTNGEKFDLVKVLDMQGRVVEAYSFSSTDNNFIEPDLPPGMYFLQLFSQGQNIAIHRIIKH